MCISFRKAEPKDFDEIVVLYNLVIKTTYTTWDENYPSKTMLEEDIANGNLFVIISEGKVVGAASVNTCKAVEDKCKVGSFARICTSPKCQGKGYGTKFVKFLEDYFLDAGCNKIILRVSTKNAAAIKMYTRCGFQNVGTDFAFNLDWFVFEKTL